MERTEIYFSSIPISMIGVIFQFHPINELSELSKVCRKFKNALKQEFMWEQFAVNDELFLPREKENFKWREYFFYLKHLKENIQSGKPNLNFKMKPLRSHKNYITAINYLYYACSYKIISGDNNGVVLTWSKDQYDDYESVTIIDHKESITQIKIFSTEKVLIDSLSIISLIHYNSTKDQFSVVSQHNKKNEDFTHIEIDNGLIYTSCDFNDINSLQKTNPIINCYNPLTWKKVNEFILTFDPNLKAKIYSLIDNTNIPQLSVKTKLPLFTIIENKLISALNYDSVKRYSISGLVKQNDIQVGNCFIFKTDTILSKPENIMIPLKFIINIVDLNKEKGLLAFTGQDIDNHSIFLLLIYRNDTVKNDIIFTKKIILSNNLDTYDLVFYSETKIVFFNQLSSVKVVNLDSGITIEIKEKCSREKINVVTCDKYRILFCYNANIVDVFNMKTNERWYSLLTGSSTVIPKSLVAHPTCDGINKALITRWSIIGVIGNLIREYSFQPTYIFKQK